MKEKIYIMRPEWSRNGLLELIEHINTFTDTKKLRMLEIGAYAGESTLMFSEYFKEVITIDPYVEDYDPNDITCKYLPLNEVYKKFLENTREVNNITLIKKTSDEAFIDLKNDKFDFIYIDGVHTYEQVKKDINNFKNIVSENGFLGGHDYHKNWAGVINAVNESFVKVDKVFSDTSWLIKL